MEKKISYEEAVSQLEQIVARMENDEMDLDQLGDQLKKAQRLIRLCKDKLTKTEKEIGQILGDEEPKR